MPKRVEPFTRVGHVGAETTRAFEVAAQPVQRIARERRFATGLICADCLFQIRDVGIHPRAQNQTKTPFQLRCLDRLRASSLGNALLPRWKKVVWRQQAASRSALWSCLGSTETAFCGFLVSFSV